MAKIFLTLGFTCASAANSAQPHAGWLQQPCALLSSGELARVLPADEAGLVAKPYIGRRESDCLWTDTAAGQTLRLVLYPARDATRVAGQLKRLQAQDAGAVTFDVGSAAALLSGDRSRLNIAVDNWMVSLIGSSPLDAELAQSTAEQLVKRMSLAVHAP
jgi:hypothetical protein